jgi:DNA-binding response OmpR family regulator
MAQKTVLIVDDDIDFSSMLKEVLEAEGLTVIVEHDGVSGVAKALELKPDLVMFDFMMPRLSGVAALTQIREDAWGKNVPAVLLTNMGTTEAMGAVQANPGIPTRCLLKTDLTLDQIAEQVMWLLAE